MVRLDLLNYLIIILYRQDQKVNHFLAFIIIIIIIPAN